MRIIGGKLSGRTITAPRGTATRPTQDRLREALFDIITHRDWDGIGDPLTGATVLDAFCGTGALAFEALSRGASHAVLFDQDRNALRTAKENAAKLGLAKVCQIVNVDARHPPKVTGACRLVFLDPPYGKNLIAPALSALDEAGWIAKDALIIAETAKKEILELPENFAPFFSRFYGDTGLHFVHRV
ncbi:MAG TPA: 16S rRNA (guanine(966)-N(2))-methyltransferase RsmD [Alphaproteobacteria bacterium]|nr:16S rRNA (guanine(966)-N(2))-methyltransferase RsmD [Alphaproteobacteria bacterium]